MQQGASISGLNMPRTCSFHHQRPLEAARYSPTLDFTKPSHSLERVCDPYIALPRVKQVKTLILKGCRNSSAICPPFCLPARNLDAIGITPAGRLLEVLTAVTSPSQESENAPKSTGKTARTHSGDPLMPSLHHFWWKIQISRVPSSFFCYTAAGKKKNHQKPNSLTNLNYMKEEILAKLLLSSPVPWHKKQFN